MKRTLFTMLGLAALLAGCSKDAIDTTPVDTPVTQDEVRYISLAIGTPAALTGRAEPTFEAATSEEVAVDEIILVFYDNAGNYITHKEMTPGQNDPAAGSGSVDKIYSNVVEVEIKRGSNLPTQVLAFVNPTDLNTNLVNKSISEVEQKAIKNIVKTSGSSSYFAMSNSVYFDAAGNYIFATPIENVQLFTKKADAEAALANYSSDASKVLDIYVERYAAKVSMKFKESNNSFTLGNGDGWTITRYKKEGDGEAVQLGFTPKAWAVNAVEDYTYVTKSFFESVTEGSTAGEFTHGARLSYNDIETALNGSATNKWTWNSPANHRSYWAQTPAYYASKYPLVSDNIKDNRTSTTDYTDKGGYSLRYYSYNQITEEAASNAAAKDKFASSVNGSEATSIYAKENTVSTKVFTDGDPSKTENPKSTVASLVLVGEYKVTGAADIAENETFYLVGSTASKSFSLFKEDELKEYLFENFLKGEIFKDASGANAAEYADLQAQLKIAHPDKDARNADGSVLLVDSRYVTIQFSGAKTGYYANVNGAKLEITAGNLASVNQMMLIKAGYARGYQKGQAYFSTPIKHLGYGTRESANASCEPQSEAFDWGAVKAGDFGLVRNHAYSIVIESISGLGTGIPDGDDPIVPPVDESDYYFATRINILNWAKLADQNVEF